MYRKIIKNDVRDSKMITIITTLFITVAALLVALATILSVNLAGSIDTLMEKSQSPHYMQMHTGEVNRERLAKFVEADGNVATYEVAEFLNLNGSDIELGDHSLADSVEDNGLAVQSKNLDYFLDMENQPIQPKPGELYVPVMFKKQGLAKIGDKAKIAGKTFTINGFLRDGTMNSQMAGSKRFLLHQTDYDELFSKGKLEYIIQFRLKDPSKLNQFEAAYKKAGLEVNGPSGTHRLFKLGNAMSDGIMIGILLLISLLVVLMTFMCIRFTLLAKIEEDYKEIGVMKAIGLQLKAIKKIYLAKYAAISIIGSLLGYLISLPLSYLLLKNIKLFMGESKNEGLSWILAVAGVLAVMLLMIAYVYVLLNRFKKISAVEAIRFSGANEKVNTKTRFNLRRLACFSPDTRIGIIDIMNRKKIYLTMLLVFIISTFIMIVPALVYHTTSSEEFVESLGFSHKIDIATSLYQSTNSVENQDKIEDYLANDSDVEMYSKISTKNFDVKEAGVENGVLSVELGNHQKFPVNYLKGHAPRRINEIALSTINADEYNKKIGDPIILIREGREEKFIVCGIYANLFNGGKTAKAIFEDRTTPTIWTDISIKLKNPSKLTEKMNQYKEDLPFAKMNNAEQYRDQTFGSTIQSLLMVAIGASLVAVLITGLITSLFMKLLLVKDKKEIATLKAIGLTNQEIRNQYLARSLTILVLGIGLGTGLAMTLGKTISGLVSAGLGGVSVQLIGSPLIYLGCPLLLLIFTYLTSRVVTTQVGKIEIAENLKD
ncbi:FtsX-like permease family protein [Enterococcus hulanensis]|uniref:ABC transporter permease n=1 Tax=Enterococcus hulanensis TaxID=2559929 RepID=UPI001A8BFE19|nr:FtsX-like permease family protein [Enterococcus hulanensis]MBO0458768.1 FtsX-like permease family protein [Enterococcus hulanensis]